MQVVHWLPRTELPFAAPSRPELLVVPAPEPVLAPHIAAAPAARPQAASPAAEVLRSVERAKIEIPRPAAKPVVKEEPAAKPPQPVAKAAPAPRFALQLLRAGACMLLVELPTGEPFQSRDPAYLLLKDMLRAAGLPDSPQIIGEPVRWPLLSRGSLDQGPDAARDFVQGFVSVRLEEAPCACLWLLGVPALRFAGETDSTAYYQEVQVEGLGTAWALPGLELLMDEPQRKADVWHAMRRMMARWKSTHE